MREMTITVMCDSCGAPIEGADGGHEGTPIMFRNSGELRVDLCKGCGDEIWVDLKPILERGLRPESRNGHSGRKPIPPRTQVDCPKCGKQVSVGAGMTLHARKKHPEEAVALIAQAHLTAKLDEAGS